MTSKQARSTFYVVRVDGDPRDTHASDTLKSALEIASPDEGAVAEWGMVRACDAGAARLMEPEVWALVVSSTEGTSEGYCAPCLASILAAENQAMRVALVGAKEALEYVLGWNPVTWSAETARDRCRTAIRHASESLELGR